MERTENRTCHRGGGRMLMQTRRFQMRTRKTWSKHTTALLTTSLFSLLLMAQPCYAGSDPAPTDEPTLLETLYKKGVITDAEYEQLKKRDSKVDKVLKFLGGISIGTLSYFHMNGGEDDYENFAKFRITRGYINIKKKFNSWLSFRITPDAHQEANGDFKLRLKYLYAEFRPPNLLFLTDMRSEVGIGHMPWLDFEEHINPYRCQGTMFIERAGMFNSADLGVSIRGFFGGQLAGGGREYSTMYKARWSLAYPGRWGSWHVGVYNGGGYHANEVNMNKVPEWRVSFRPLPDMVPGLQLHYFGLWGKGNSNIPTLPLTGQTESPDYQVNLGMVSYQNPWITLTGQYARTLGNQKGTFVVVLNDVPTPRALTGQGFSFFFNGKIPYILDRKLNVFARWDYFQPDVDHLVTTGNNAYNLAFAGVAWEFFPHWYLLVDYQRVMHESNNGGVGELPVEGANLPDSWQVQGVLQISF